jgi:Bacterial Ig-like domain (group 3)
MRSKRDPHRSHRRRRRFLPLEVLEKRALMAAASETFNAPSLSDLIQGAQQGQYTAPAAINRMLNALESQLTSGPLGDLNSGAVDGDGFIQEVQSLEASYEQNLNSQLSPEFPNVDELLLLQGQRIVADLDSLNQQSTVGLISSSDLASDAQTAIDSLTSGPIYSLGTPVSTYQSVTSTFESALNELDQSLSSSAATPLTSAQVSTTLLDEAGAYQADMHAGLEVTNPNISSTVDSAVYALESAGTALASETTSLAQTSLASAISTFNGALLAQSSLFGSQGAVSQAVPSGGALPENLTDIRSATTFSSVSGTAPVGGPATLVATLTSAASGQGIPNETVYFTLDGAFAGTAITDSNGDATLADVPTSDAAGTDTGGVVAYFAGDVNYISGSGTGDLTVGASSSNTTLSSVSGSDTYGGTASLSATLTSTQTGAGISGETIDFTLDGTSVGSATTDSDGVATLSDVTTSDATGTYNDDVVASFAGDTTNGYGASTGSGDLTVSQADTSLGTVSGTDIYGGTATLTATLTSSETNTGVSGEAISFTLDGTSVGTATTNSSGVATLTGVATSDAVGTDSSGVVASFAGDTNYAASSGTGNLVVSEATTSISSVSGSAVAGGTATLMATLTTSATNAGLSGQSVTFTLNGSSVGTETTNSSGVATLSDVSITDGVGTYDGVVGASFTSSNGDETSSSGTGNLLVSQNASSIGSVSGTASLGGTATLTATLTSSGTGVSGETISFTLDGTSVGTATTNSSGVATLTGVATTDAVGTDTNGVVASFAGDTTYAPSSGTGNLVVSEAGTTVSSILGSAAEGSTAILTAILTSSVTDEPITGETITFTLSGTSVGTATTGPGGLAILSGVANTDGVGSYTGVVGASFAGDSNYETSSGTGNLVVGATASTLGSVSGTATLGGTATLTATLTSSGTGISGQTISFMLDGTSVGTATTNSSGVATLTGVATTDAVGTDTNGVFALFTGNTSYASSNAFGNLVVSQAATSIASVSGSAAYGGTASLSATLTSSVTDQGLAGQTVTFTLDGTSVGTATTNTSGVATLSGVTTTDAAGTDTNGIVASFAGDTNYASSSGTGNLVVSQAATSIGSVSGSAVSGGTATLTATLTSSVTNQGVAGETISFTLDGTSVGTATTDSSGVAVLTDVPTTDAQGTDTNGVVASFAGDTNYTSSSGKGNLVVS